MIEACYSMFIRSKEKILRNRKIDVWIATLCTLISGCAPVRKSHDLTDIVASLRVGMDMNTVLRAVGPPDERASYSDRPERSTWTYLDPRDKTRFVVVVFEKDTVLRVAPPVEDELKRKSDRR